jgi:hypothetical protein
MQVRHSLPGVRPLVYHQPIAAFSHLELLGKGCAGAEEAAQRVEALCRLTAEVDYMGKRNDEDVDWCLGFDVPNSKDRIVLVEKFRGNFSSANLTEEAVLLGHGMPKWRRSKGQGCLVSAHRSKDYGAAASLTGDGQAGNRPDDAVNGVDAPCDGVSNSAQVIGFKDDNEVIGAGDQVNGGYASHLPERISHFSRLPYCRFDKYECFCRCYGAPP